MLRHFTFVLIKYKFYTLLLILYLGITILLFPFCKSKEVKEPSTHIKPNKNNTTEQQAYLGIIYIETSSGVQIAEVFPDSPASKAKLEPGDLILTANGYPVLGSYTLKEHIFSLKSGSEVILEVEKLNGKKVIVKAILEPMPEKYKNILK